MSSLTTTAPGFGANRPVALSPRLETWPICEPDSDEPPASRMVSCGSSSMKRCLSGAVSAAPPVISTSSPDRS